MLTLNTMDASGWLAYSFCGFAILSLSATLLGRKYPSVAAWWMRKLDEWERRSKIRRMRGWARTNEFPIAVIFSALVLTSLGWMTYKTRYPIAHYTEVVIYPQNENGDWRMDGREDFGDHEYRRGIMFRPCEPDLIKAILKQAADEGWIAHDVSWQQRPTCQSVYEPEWGFNFNDENGNYRRIAHAGTTAQ